MRNGHYFLIKLLVGKRVLNSWFQRKTDFWPFLSRIRFINALKIWIHWDKWCMVLQNRSCHNEAHRPTLLNWCNLRNHRTQHWENIQISRSIKNMDVLSFRILWFLKYLHYGWNIQFHWGWIDHFQLWISFWTPECSLRLCYNEVTLPFWCVLRNHRILNDGTSRFFTQIQLRAVRPVGYRRR